MAMEKQQPKFKILMFPWLAHGHISPFLELSKRLSATNYFSIYLCSTAVNLDSIKSSLQKHSSSDADNESIKLVELRLPSSPELPQLLQTTKNLPSNLVATLLKAFQMSSCSFSDIMDSVKPDLLIYDLFQPWAAKLASSQGIPSVFLAISGATPFSLYHHIYSMATAATFPYLAICPPEDEIIDQRSIRQYVKDADDEFAFGSFALSSDIVLMKTYAEIEDKYIDYLSVLCKKQIVSTGPLIVDANDCDDKLSSEIIEWLNGKNPHSTVYISFGSECFLSKEQIAEIAKGLQLCDVNFLWVVRFPVEEKATSIEEELPARFVETTNERGLVLTRWAPQMKILAHPSVGGFVSHCGWNSITESMYFGVPVIAMPMKTHDQPITARLVVEAGFGVEVEKHGNGHFVGENVAKAINKVMVEKTFYEGMRSRAKTLSEKMKEDDEQKANEVAEQLLRICMEKKKQV